MAEETEKGSEQPTQERKSDTNRESQTRSSKEKEKKKNGKKKNGKGKNGKKTNGKRKNGKKTNGNGKNGKKKDGDKEFIQLPPCRHAYCLGEVLKAAGIEPGVCRPRPLPWALTGRLPYLPGWEKECRHYKLQQVCYEVKPKKLNPDQERFANELKEAKLLWSFLKPAILFPMKPVYEDPEPGILCACKAGTCKREPPPEES